jgi:hypothetical protein
MIKHIVMWRLKEHAEGNDKAVNARLVKQKLEALRGRIPGMLKVEVGIDFSATDASADVVLYSEFESREALDGYQAHPEHEALKPFVSAVRVSRQLVDYEI